MQTNWVSISADIALSDVFLWNFLTSSSQATQLIPQNKFCSNSGFKCDKKNTLTARLRRLQLLRWVVEWSKTLGTYGLYRTALRATQQHWFECMITLCADDFNWASRLWHINLLGVIVCDFLTWLEYADTPQILGALQTTQLMQLDKFCPIYKPKLWKI